MASRGRHIPCERRPKFGYDLRAHSSALRQVANVKPAVRLPEKVKSDRCHGRRYGMTGTGEPRATRTMAKASWHQYD